MSTKIRVEFLSDGFQQVLNQPGVKDLLDREARGIASRAGDGFKASSGHGNYGGSPRPIAVVGSSDYEGRRAEAEDQALSKALWG